MNITIPGQVSYLSDGTEAQRGEFPFSPVVRVDFPAFEEGMHGHQAPELGDTAAAPFLKPISLIMPHCFDPGATSHDTAQHDRCMTHQAHHNIICPSSSITLCPIASTHSRGPGVVCVTRSGARCYPVGEVRHGDEARGGRGGSQDR